MSAKSGLVAAGAACALAGCMTYTEDVAVGYPAAQQAGLIAPGAFPPGLVWDVVWTRTPAASALESIYPQRAASLRLGGRAAAECIAGETGELSSCKLLEERPSGFGFGAATLALAGELQASPQTKGGRDLRGRPIRYQIAFEAGPRFSQLGFCERVRLELEPRSSAAEAAATASLSRRAPLLVKSEAEAKRLIDRAQPAARAVVSEQPESARKIAEDCGPQPNEVRDFSLAAPEALLVWRDEAGRSHAIRRADWAVRPVAADVLRVYPPIAVARGVGGGARVQCRVATTGSLHGCVVVEESPAGYGFGEAVVRLAETSARMTPETIDGVPSGDGVVVVPASFAVR